MRFRGSLRKCIEVLPTLYRDKGLPMLSIICAPRGKYYFVLTEEELLDYNTRDKSNEMRLVFRGTERELQTFSRYTQTDLFQGTDADEHKTNHTGGQ